MIFYILRDHPEMSVTEIITESRQMMDGHKLDLFLFQLSFIGWGLLSILTLGIGLFWLVPYMQVSTYQFYERISGKNDVEPTVTSEEV